MEKFSVIIYDCGNVTEIKTNNFEEALKIAKEKNKGYFSTTSEIYDNEKNEFIEF